MNADVEPRATGELGLSAMGATVADECRVAIIDSYPLYRTGIALVIGREPGFSVVGEGATVHDAKSLAQTRNPHVLLLDTDVPDSLGAAKTILSAYRSVKIAFIALAEDLAFAAEAIHAGVHGYITKGITGQELVNAIATIHAGQRYIAPDLAWRLIVQPASSPARRKGVDREHLSPREQQVLSYSSQGHSNREISRMLGLGLSTIKSCKTAAYRKIGVRNRVEAATLLLSWLGV